MPTGPYNFAFRENALRARAILLVFEKIYSCLFIPNCTRNHVITCTNRENFEFAHAHERRKLEEEPPLTL